MAYTAGQALLQIVPSFKGVADAIDAEAEKWGVSAGTSFGDAFSGAAREGTKDAIPSEDGTAAEKGSSAGGAFADAFRARVDAALKALPEADIRANATEFDQELADIRVELESLRNQRIGIDISDDEAMAKLAELKAALDEIGLSSENVRIRVDASQASAEIAAFEGEIAGADAATGSLGGDAGGAAGGVGALGASAGEAGPEIGAMAAAIAAAIPLLSALGGLAGGALAALPAIFSGLGSGLGALKLGLGGIQGALSAYSTQQKDAAKATGGSAGAVSNAASSALSNAQSIRNAANAVASAEEALANAQQQATDSVRQANEQLRQSELALADAEYNEQQAQQALTQARIDAQNQLTNYADQVADGALAIQQAQLDVQSAQAGLAAAGPGSGSTPLQQAQAELTYQQAVQRLKDLQDQQAQLKQAADAANAAGVDGSQQVTSAQHQLLDAQNAVATAQQSQADAQTSLSEAEVAAVQKVTDAQNALTNAILNQQVAQEQAALSGAGGGGGGGGGLSGATNAFDSAMAQLSPQGQAFVNYLIGFKQQIHDIGNEIQAVMVPGLMAGMQAAQPFFTLVGNFLVIAGAGIGQFAEKFGEFLGSAKGLSETNAIFQSGAGFMSQMGDAALTLFKAFGSIGSQAGPIVSAIGDGIVHLVDAFAKWAEGKGFQDFLAWLRENGPSIVGDLGDVFRLLGNFLVIVAPLGKTMLDLVAAVARFLESIRGAFKLAIDAVALSLKGWQLIFENLTHVIDFFSQHWRQLWADVKQWADDAYQHVKSAIFDPLVNFFTQTIPHTFDTVVGWFVALPKRLADAVGDIVDTIFGALKAVGSWLENNVWHPLEAWFTAVPGRIASAIGDFFSAAWSALVAVGSWLEGHVAEPAIGWFTALPGRIAGALGDILGTVFSGLVTVGSWLEANFWAPIANFFTGPNGIVTRLEGVGSDIGNAITGALKRIWNTFAQGWNNTLGGVLSSVSSFLGGPSLTLPILRAAGGPVNANDPYIVGEVGPEIFVPDGSGTILPASVTSNLISAAVNLPSPDYRSLAGGSSQPVGSAPVFDRTEMHLHNEADIDGLMRQASFRRKARVL